MSKFKEALFEEVAKRLDETTGVRQVDVAQQLGISQMQVSMIKRGRFDYFSLDKLVDIAAATGVSFEWRFLNVDPIKVVSTAPKRSNASTKNDGFKMPDFARLMEDE